MNGWPAFRTVVIYAEGGAMVFVILGIFILFLVFACPLSKESDEGDDDAGDLGPTGL